MPTNAEKIQDSIDNLVTLLLEKTEEWIENGRPPSFSIDGESYQWDSWVSSVQKDIEALTALKQTVGGSFIVRSKGAN